jgi:surface protein
MKSLKDLVCEKLILNKDKIISKKYKPNNHDELVELINKLYDKDTKYIDARSIDVSNIDNFDEIFDDYKEVYTIDLSGWDVSNGLSFDSMFHNCDNLENIIGIEDFTFKQSDSLKWSYFFFSCRSLKELDLSSWYKYKPTFVSGMFWGCWSLKSVGDLSKWDVSNVISANMMFNDCLKLQYVGDLSEWKLNSCYNTDRMFRCCALLENIGNISNWPSECFKSITEMFYGCKKLIADCSKWEFNKRLNKKGIKSAFTKTSKKLLKPNYE